MHRRIFFLLAVGALAVTVIVVGPAVGRAPGPKTHEPHLVRALGNESFEANTLIQATFRFSPERSFPHTGERLRWVDRDSVEEPHTITIVRRGQLPTSLDEVFDCQPCNDALGQHFSTDPPSLRVDVGQPGLDQPGDSLLLLPGTSIGAVVSAPAGTNLRYLCSIHPWMQGKIVVG